MSVLHAFESKTLESHDLFTSDDYCYRFELDAKRRFIGVLRKRFNSGAVYKGRILKWDTVTDKKAGESRRFLIGKSSTLDSAQSTPQLKREDDRGLRTKILALTSAGAKQLGIEKSMLHYLRKRIMVRLREPKTNPKSD